MKAVVFANGVIENHARALIAANNSDLLIAADGGAQHLLQLGLTPNMIVGDLDSLDGDVRLELESRGIEFTAHPSEKDQTDLELALLSALDRGCQEIIVLGAMGGRLDMTLANLLLLELPALKSTRVELWHSNQTAWLVRPPGDSIRGALGDTVSLIPVGGDASGVTSHDLQYSLKEEILTSGPARGISNVVSGPNARVELRTGALLIVHTSGPAGSGALNP